MDTEAAAHDVALIQSWGYTRKEAIQAAARWALRCLRREGADTILLCYLRDLSALATPDSEETSPAA
jgi:hypothetical protein